MKQQFIKNKQNLKNVFLLLTLLIFTLNGTNKEVNSVNEKEVNSVNEIIEKLKKIQKNAITEIVIEKQSLIFPPNFNEHFTCNDNYTDYIKNCEKMEYEKITFLLPPPGYSEEGLTKYREYMKKHIEIYNKIKTQDELEEKFVPNTKKSQRERDKKRKYNQKCNKKPAERGNRFFEKTNEPNKEEIKKEKSESKSYSNSEEKDKINNLEEEFSILNFAPEVKDETEFFKSLEKNTSLQKSQNNKTSHSKNKYLESLRLSLKKNKN